MEEYRVSEDVLSEYLPKDDEKMDMKKLLKMFKGNNRSYLPYDVSVEDFEDKNSKEEINFVQRSLYIPYEEEKEGPTNKFAAQSANYNFSSDYKISEESESNKLIGQYKGEGDEESGYSVFDEEVNGNEKKSGFKKGESNYNFSSNYNLSTNYNNSEYELEKSKTENTVRDLNKADTNKAKKSFPMLEEHHSEDEESSSEEMNPIVLLMGDKLEWKKSKGEQRDWNQQFQKLLALEDTLEKFESLRQLAQDFVYCAEVNYSQAVQIIFCSFFPKKRLTGR